MSTEKTLQEEIERTRQDAGETVDELTDRLVATGRSAAAPLAMVVAALAGTVLVIVVLRRRSRRR